MKIFTQSLINEDTMSGVRRTCKTFETDSGEWLRTFQFKIRFRLSSSYWIFTSAGMAERKVRDSWAKAWSNFNTLFLNYRISQLAWFTTSSASTFCKTSIMDWKHSQIIFVLGREEVNWASIVFQSANCFFCIVVYCNCQVKTDIFY